MMFFKPPTIPCAIVGARTMIPRARPLYATMVQPSMVNVVVMNMELVRMIGAKAVPADASSFGDQLQAQAESLGDGLNIGESSVAAILDISHGTWIRYVRE